MVELKVLQINVGKGKDTTCEMLKLAKEEDTDIIAIQEPQSYNNKITGISDGKYSIIANEERTRPKASLAIKKNLNPIKINDCTSDFCSVAAIKSGNKLILLCSLYLNLVEVDGKDRDIKKDLIYVQRIFDKYNNGRTAIFVFTDANCIIEETERRRFKERDLFFLEFVNANSLTIHNDLKKGPTFVKFVEEDGATKLRCSLIDFTLSNEAGSDLVKNWNIVDKINTEHRQIFLNIIEEDNARNREYTPTTKLFNTDKLNWNVFKIHYNQDKPSLKLSNYSEDNLEKLAIDFTANVTKALEKSAKRIIRKENDQPWYDENLRESSKEIRRIRNKVSRSAGKTNNTYWLENLRELNKAHRKLIQKTKQKYYEKLNHVNTINDLWKLLKKAKTMRGESFEEYKKKDGQSTIDTDEINRDLFDHFVPQMLSNGIDDMSITNTGLLDPLEENELKNAMKYTLNKKAPGLDAIPNLVIKKMINLDANYLNEMYNLFIKYIYFPKCWKIGSLILFQKAGKKLTDAKSLRPITLLPGFGKILEKILIDRIRKELNRRSFFNDNQFGFTTGKSTAKAIEKINKAIKVESSVRYSLVLAIDISGAFDNLKFDHVIKNLIRSGVDNCYLLAMRQLLNNREIIFESSRESFKRRTKIGCPQGGKASPCIWLIGMNDLLNDLDKLEIMSLAFADDLIMILNGKSIKEVEKRISSVLTCINDWCKRAGLKINADKSVLMNVGKIKFPNKININGKEVKTQESIKYLGVMISRDRKWKEHLNLIEEKICKFNRTMGRMRFMNKNLSLEKRRILYNQVCLPIIDYCSSVWYKELVYKYQKDKLNRIQRSSILQLTGAYRTSGNVNLLNLFGVLDINTKLEIDEKHVKANRKVEYKLALENQGYREEFELLDKTTSKEIIWFKLNHGPFKQYLRRLNLANDSECRFCNLGDETADHLLFECVHFKELRVKLNCENIDSKYLEVLEQEMRAKKICVELYKNRELLCI